MLAGLIFATEDATDRADALAATLPFGGSSLIEYQARLLAAAGVTHVLVAVSRVTPALLGAVNRIGQRGVAVDIVRSAEESAARIHPLAQVIVVADGLVTTDAVVDWVAAESHEALLVTRDGDGTPGVERIDSGHSWAGLARMPASRLAEVARMPADYDFQSSLLRQSSQAGAIQLVLPAGTGRTRHGVERSAAALLQRGKSVLAALGDRRTAWVDRYLFTPITGWTLPRLVARGVPGWALIAAASLVALGAVFAFYSVAPVTGLVLAIAATAILFIGSMLSWLRAEDIPARGQERGGAAVSGVAVLLTGVVSYQLSADWAGPVLALVTIAAVALIERVPGPRRRWWGTPGAYPLLLLPFAAVGWVATGLGVGALYAFASLAAAIEACRRIA